MQQVKFIKPWRGHRMGAITDLTDERAAELLSGQFCVLLTDQQSQQAPPIAMQGDFPEKVRRRRRRQPKGQ